MRKHASQPHFRHLGIYVFQDHSKSTPGVYDTLQASLGASNSCTSPAQLSPLKYVVGCGTNRHLGVPLT
jgi:hypothetical protein